MPDPHVRIVPVGLRGHAQDVLDLRVDVGGDVAVVGVDHGRDLFHEAAVALLRVGERGFGLATGDQCTGVPKRGDHDPVLEFANAHLDREFTVRAAEHRLERHGIVG